jgi:hypothetical protein
MVISKGELTATDARLYMIQITLRTPMMREAVLYLQT